MEDCCGLFAIFCIEAEAGKRAAILNEESYPQCNAMLQLVSESFGSSNSDNFGKIQSRAKQAFGIPEESGSDI